jgi:hypothetical protein
MITVTRGYWYDPATGSTLPVLKSDHYPYNNLPLRGSSENFTRTAESVVALINITRAQNGKEPIVLV